MPANGFNITCKLKSRRHLNGFIQNTSSDKRAQTGGGHQQKTNLHPAGRHGIPASHANYALLKPEQSPTDLGALPTARCTSSFGIDGHWTWKVLFHSCQVQRPATPPKEMRSTLVCLFSMHQKSNWNKITNFNNKNLEEVRRAALGRATTGALALRINLAPRGPLPRPRFARCSLLWNDGNTCSNSNSIKLGKYIRLISALLLCVFCGSLCSVRVARVPNTTYTIWSWLALLWFGGLGARRPTRNTKQNSNT